MVEIIIRVEKVGIRVVCVDVSVVEPVWVVVVIRASAESDPEVTTAVVPSDDCVSCRTSCSGLTIAIAKMSVPITEIAIRDANANSSWSWRFKRNCARAGQGDFT